MGTDSCYALDLGDNSVEFSFGYNKTYCTEVQKMHSSYFYQLTEDKNLYQGEKSYYDISGDIGKGDGQLNFTYEHIYTESKVYTV